MQRVLIIGANSFLAATLARKWKAASADVELHGVYHKKTHLIESSLYAQLYSVEDTWQYLADVDAVIFCSSYIPYGKMHEPSAVYNSLNCELLHPALKAFNRSRFVYCSSVSIYGDPVQLPLTEDSQWNNPSHYGRSKLTGELLMGNHPNSVSLRFSSIYGAGMARNSLIPIWCEAAKEKKSITVYGDGSRLQDYIHVEDAASGLIAAAQTTVTGGLLCVSGHSVSNKELAEMIASKVEGTVIQYANEDSEASFQYDNQRSTQQLEWQAEINIQDGLDDLV